MLDYNDVVRKIAKALVLECGYGSDSPGFDACIEGAIPEAKAALTALQDALPEPAKLGWDAAQRNLSYQEIQDLDAEKLYQQLKSLGRE